MSKVNITYHETVHYPVYADFYPIPSKLVKPEEAIAGSGTAIVNIPYFGWIIESQ
ncbi:MAG: hypothetical protein LBG87_09120 [Spirochaetaceae bacterium]|jgi:hypothetical protein|nr:hypothetical protein [Spirochaetaceae bacterium]